MPKVFSSFTLEKFEEAAAGVPLRPLNRAFDAAKIALGEDPGGPPGSRREQFRRYVATVDQRDVKQRDRLGDALGTLVTEVATSKQDFLIQTAERDGFFFANGAFRESGASPSTFALTATGDLSSLEERGRRLNVLAGERPRNAVAGARELLVSVCRAIGDPDGAAPRTDQALTELVEAALAKRGPSSPTLRRLFADFAALHETPEPAARDARLIAAITVALLTYLTAP